MVLYIRDDDESFRDHLYTEYTATSTLSSLILIYRAYTSCSKMNNQMVLAYDVTQGV